MKILVAEDDLFTRSTLETILTKWGHQLISVPDGNAAWDVLQQANAPQLALLDWIMPGIDGLDLVHKVRHTLSSPERYIYMIFLTQKMSKEDVVAGIEAGADDYIVKPFNPEELRARIRSGERIVSLQSDLTTAKAKLEGTIGQLQEVMGQVKKLSGMLPICASCKKVRDDTGYWQQIEEYIRDHSEADFTHGICPECANKLYPELSSDK